jgi:hypothetical protein
MTVTNNSGRSEAVYLYVLGVSLKPGGRLGYVNSAGTHIPWTGGSLPPSPAPDVSMPGPANGQSVTLRIPRELSGRIYMSFGEKLRFFLSPDGLVQPAPWAPNDPNRNILFDTSEFTYNGAGLWLNSSQVDMFAIPHAVTVTGSNGVTRRTGDVVSDGRNRVINAIRNQPHFDRTVHTRADGTVLRVWAPGKAADAGVMDPNYLDPYINTAWNVYTNRTLTVVPFQHEPNTKFFGRTSGNVMNFTNTAGQHVASFSKPSTANVWGCDGALHAPNDHVVGPIARTLCTAIHRSTLGKHDVEPRYDRADFYQGSITNHYSRIIHENMADGKAYGFAFDDVAAQESLVHDGDPRSASVIISPFGPGGQPPGGGSVQVIGYNNRCMDISGGSSNPPNLTPVIMWDCHGGGNQKWEFASDGTLRSSGKCLDVKDANPNNGTPLQVVGCGTQDAQKFTLHSNGQLRSALPGNRCVDVADWNPNNGARLQLWDCNPNGQANQTWRKG